ncbi:helix-turn-helix domain-containing protein [Allorhizobium borbori]|jgi:transcriptional regulator with XRE-family HTH domain|uniref:Transcriptional regulator with XRE-family HTH domain n=1 Tax=Allorhizobium borbori TaxID=485907 RepID=A0A7W6K4G6_9HYPH|nr:helix-turn-helix transcriptional regulator [Allorhizobium borbori]MBB4105048.1 transcriptional regulator with XRE-family HTH domain [Allorhizobium borbori]PZU24620.1 MAG: transcriptional regulator [Shinella sp.]
MKAEPHKVDVEVGKKIRVQRTMKKMSQTELGNRIGVTFQQVQKYERGSNRVSASKLVEIARALDVDVRLFFDGLEEEAGNNDNQPVSKNFITSRQGLLLNAAFFSIADERIRENILRLVQTIASGSPEA